MKGSETFKKTIQAYLEKRAQTDALFTPVYAKPSKNIDDCITYILNAVKQSGCNGFADEEIYSMAVHYYDEDKINIGKPSSCSVVVNHAVQLTDEEKEQARKDALKRVQDEAYQKMAFPAKKKPETQATTVTNQLNLF